MTTASADRLVPEVPFRVDDRRAFVQAERHARPPLPVRAPAICQHLVFRDAKGQDLAQERRTCLDICEALGLTPSGELSDQISASGDGTTLKWERHTEFSSFTFVAQEVGNAAGYKLWSGRDAPWDQIAGSLMISLVIGVQHDDDPVWSKTGHFRWRTEPPLCASSVMSDTTTVESDMLIDEAGHTRFLVRTRSREAERLGRLVQRLFEIETYGAFCLYAWKDAKEIGPILSEADRKLGDLTGRLAAKEREPDEHILRSLTELSAEQEATTSRSHFRFNASLAYHEIVLRRLNELREERIEGRQRIGNFVQRRMNPAARTYRAILTRQEETAERINRATQLLRSRIEVDIGQQNQQLLASMNERAEAQYKLQRTVEGLSVVAITYYALGILAYLAAVIAGAVPGIGVKEIVGLAVPVVLVAVWYSLKRLRE